MPHHRRSEHGRHQFLGMEIGDKYYIPAFNRLQSILKSGSIGYGNILFTMSHRRPYKSLRPGYHNKILHPAAVHARITDKCLQLDNCRIRSTPQIHHIQSMDPARIVKRHSHGAFPQRSKRPVLDHCRERRRKSESGKNPLACRADIIERRHEDSIGRDS